MLGPGRWCWNSVYSKGELARFADCLGLCPSTEVTRMSPRMGIGQVVGEGRQMWAVQGSHISSVLDASAWGLRVEGNPAALDSAARGRQVRGHKQFCVSMVFI